MTYEINVFCDTPERMRVLYSDLHRNILDVFNEYGVQIMTPAYEGDPERAQGGAKGAMVYGAGAARGQYRRRRGVE